MENKNNETLEEMENGLEMANIRISKEITKILKTLARGAMAIPNMHMHTGFFRLVVTDHGITASLSLRMPGHDADDEEYDDGDEDDGDDDDASDLDDMPDLDDLNDLVGLTAEEEEHLREY